MATPGANLWATVMGILNISSASEPPGNLCNLQALNCGAVSFPNSPPGLDVAKVLLSPGHLSSSSQEPSELPAVDMGFHEAAESGDQLFMG